MLHTKSYLVIILFYFHQHLALKKKTNTACSDQNRLPVSISRQSSHFELVEYHFTITLNTISQRCILFIHCFIIVLFLLMLFYLCSALHFDLSLSWPCRFCICLPRSQLFLSSITFILSQHFHKFFSSSNFLRIFLWNSTKAPGYNLSWTELAHNSLTNSIKKYDEVISFLYCMVWNFLYTNQWRDRMKGLTILQIWSRTQWVVIVSVDTSDCRRGPR